MGIRGLMPFAEMVGVKRTKTLQDIRGENQTRPKVVLVDTYNLLFSLMVDLDWFTGGRPAAMDQRFRNLVNVLRRDLDSDAELIFVLDGVQKIPNLELWVDRKRRSWHEKIGAIYDYLYEGKEFQRFYGANVMSFYKPEVVLEELGVTMIRARHEADPLIAEMAEIISTRSEAPVVIISSDNDYHAFPFTSNAMFIVSVRGIYPAVREALDNECPIRLTTIRTSELRAALKLSREQLPVLGTIAQCWDDMGSFKIHMRNLCHEAISKIDLSLPINEQIPEISEYPESEIRRLMLQYGFNKRDVNGNVIEDENLRWPKNEPWSPLFTLQSHFGPLYESCQGPTAVSCLFGATWAAFSVLGEDLARRSRLPLVEEHTRTLRRRLAGQLQQTEVSEWRVCSEKQLDSEMKTEQQRMDTFTFQLEAIECAEPSFLTLLNMPVTAEDEKKELRWNLFCNVAHPEMLDEVGLNCLQTMDPAACFMFCKLYRLQHPELPEERDVNNNIVSGRPLITAPEIRSILMMHYDLKQMSYSRLSRLTLTEYGLHVPCPRAAHLATLYIEPWVGNVNDVLGGPLPRHALRQAEIFDGKLLQLCYAACVTDKTRMEEEFDISWEESFAGWSENDQDDADSILAYLRVDSEDSDCHFPAEEFVNAMFSDSMTKREDKDRVVDDIVTELVEVSFFRLFCHKGKAFGQNLEQKKSKKKKKIVTKYKSKNVVTKL